MEVIIVNVKGAEKTPQCEGALTQQKATKRINLHECSSNHHVTYNVLVEWTHHRSVVILLLMKKQSKGLVLTPRTSSYRAAFAHVKLAEQYLQGIESDRADELIAAAYAALNEALHTQSVARRSTLYLAARMAAGLSRREAVRAEGDSPQAA